MADPRVVSRFHLQYNVILFVICIGRDGIGANGLQYKDLHCERRGKFSLRDDCSAFVTCWATPTSRDRFAVSHCPQGELFDSYKQACRPSLDVDCTKQKFPSLPSVHSPTQGKSNWRSVLGPNHHRKRRGLGEGAPARPVTRPWGKWIDGEYLPYLVWTALQTVKECKNKGPPYIGRGLGMMEKKTTTTTTLKPTIPTTTVDYGDEIIPDGGEELVIYHKVDPAKPETIRKGPVQFRSDDDDGGAVEEMKIGKKVNTNYQAWTQKPNKIAEDSPKEEVEAGIVDAPWVMDSRSNRRVGQT